MRSASTGGLKRRAHSSCLVLATLPMVLVCSFQHLPPPLSRRAQAGSSSGPISTRQATVPNTRNRHVPLNEEVNGDTNTNGDLHEQDILLTQKLFQDNGNDINALSSSKNVEKWQASPKLEDNEPDPAKVSTATNIAAPTHQAKAVESSSTTGYDIRRFRCASYLLVQAAGVGILAGWSIGIFKILIDSVQHLSYHTLQVTNPWLKLLWLPLIPTLGGFVVAILSKLGGGFPPGLRETVKSVDRYSLHNQRDPKEQEAYHKAYHPILHQFRFVKKSLAAVVTLGTGCSLGPEGPAVELGMNLSRLIMDIFPAKSTSPDDDTESGPLELFQQRRILLACGAAAGVSAGFNAPIAGAFFALEIMQQAFTSLDKESNNGKASTRSPSLTDSGNISAVLLSSVLSALVCKSLLGEHLLLALKDGYSIKTPLLELPLFLLLGATSGLSAFLFSQIAKASRSLFEGNFGTSAMKANMKKLPALSKPAIGGLVCGLVGLVYPQILFCGYDTLNQVLGNHILPTTFMLSLLFIKMATTAVAAGSGLVGGTFAPSLFLGGMVGASFHNVVSWLFQNAAGHGTIHLASPILQMADLSCYSMVGAASLLAAVFRAPLTASLLLFELTRDYGVILPILASSGVASVVGDILEAKQVDKKHRDQDEVTWGDLSDQQHEEEDDDDDVDVDVSMANPSMKPAPAT